MSKNVAISPNVAAWTFMLAATLWSVSATMPLATLTVVGLVATWVVLDPASRPAPLLASVRLAVPRDDTA